LTIFDIEKDDLLRLSDTLLEELIARLAEAEVSENGYSPAYVRWSGSINASDGGIDIHVQIPAEHLNTGFLERPDTVLQAKKHSMPKAAIQEEMLDKLDDGQLSATIAEQASKGGSYIIVSLSDDCSPTMRKNRLAAMQNAVQGDPNSDHIHLDFYDRSKLAQWLRQHPSVLLWVKGKLGQGYSGWRPYGSWSNPPRDEDDTLIASDGVSITLPSGDKLNIESAIEPMRELIRATSKAIRITGLSGVGKTRIVQSLFDEAVGSEPLDRTVAVYVDTGESPDPSANAMLDRLMTERRRAIMVLDNCPSDLHSSLASKVSAAGGEVRLITVEYDIRDDKPQETEVIHIEAVGPQIAEKLLLRRFPTIGQLNARRIAEFSDGNARVALAIAERVEEGESLGQLSDEQLFDRLFEQRKPSDNDLREQAEILSLVYSFSVSSTGEQGNELDILATIADTSRRTLLRTVNLLTERHVVQQRSHWRAILPHAITNRLAASALNSFPADEIREAFELSASPRLLMSFAHRLGLLHDHPVAKEIAEIWLSPGGLLGRLLELDTRGEKILGYIAPAAPKAVLDSIERELIAADYVIPDTDFRSCRNTILRLLKSLAYEAELFNRCTKVLLRLSDCEKENNNYDSARGILEGFFLAYLSGTHAYLQQRLDVIRECLQSEATSRRSLGLSMLRKALANHWNGFGDGEFGARPRDYGFYPNHNEHLEWRCAFIDIAVELGTCSDSKLKSSARGILANAFSGLWGQEALRNKLLDSARLLHQYSSWSEGLHAIRTKNYFDRRNQDGDTHQVSSELIELERELEPTDLIARIQAYVFPARPGRWGVDPDFEAEGTETYEDSMSRLADRAKNLGIEFSASGCSLSDLGERLFNRDDISLIDAFGQGLAQGTPDIRSYWDKLIEYLDSIEEGSRNYAVFVGFIKAVDSLDRALTQELLDQCVQHSVLRTVLVELHPIQSFTEQDLDRCMSVLERSGTKLEGYGRLFVWDKYLSLPKGRLYDLARKMLCLPFGGDVVLLFLIKNLKGRENNIDYLGLEFRSVGLMAAIQRFLRKRLDGNAHEDFILERVIASALRFDGNESLKTEWVDTILETAERHYGFIPGFDKTIETSIALMPHAFLDRVFDAPEEQHELRLAFIRSGGVERAPMAKVEVIDLIQWCRNRGDDSAWAKIAYGLNLWSDSVEQQGKALSDAAVRFLGASPDPESVLDVFAACVRPNSWSGNRSDVMQPRVDAIAKLAHHERADIASAAKLVYEKLVIEIEEMRQREQRWDENAEQKFE